MIDTNPPNPHDGDERDEPGPAQSGFTPPGAPTEPTEGSKTDLDGLTPAQANAVIALLNEPSISRAAKAAGVGERTIHSWLDRDEAFIAAYRKARRQTFGTAIALTARFAPMAVNVLGRIMVDVQAPYGSGDLADNLSRVSVLFEPAASLVLTGYEYIGLGQVVRTDLYQPNVYTSTYDPAGTVEDYDYLDQFGRVIRSHWTNGATSGTSFYDATIEHDWLSNILSTDDNVPYGADASEWADAKYGLDALGRLTDAREGHLSGGSIITSKRHESWLNSSTLMLTQTGNWERHLLDLNGNGSIAGSDIDDTATFNRANEWVNRDVTSNSSVDYTLAHDANGNLTDDGKSYKMVYDAFGRLKKVTTRGGSPTDVVVYRYNGLGYRIMWQYDASASSGLTNDERFFFAYDERWRIIQTYRDDDADPKERFVYHAAGVGGFGGSSYIDAVVMRDRDYSDDWWEPADNTLESRIYYCQNWRADVVATIGPDADGTNNGLQVLERVKYDSYGRPRLFAMGDYDHDGDVDSADSTAFGTEYSNVGGAKSDFNFNGTGNELEDYLGFLTVHALGASITDNRKLYAGYEWDPALTAGTADAGVYHVRNRTLSSELGRWTRRDPFAYVDGDNLGEYATSSPLEFTDPSGLAVMTVAFDAFINGRLGNYAPEPGNILTDWYYSTDQRGFGEFNFNLTNPNARLASIAKMDTRKIGRASLGAGVTGVSAAGWSRRYKGDPERGGKLHGRKRAIVNDPYPKVSNPTPCSTLIEFSPSAAYPFLPGPDIDYKVGFMFTLKCPGVFVEFLELYTLESFALENGEPAWFPVPVYKHNKFPDYEAYFPTGQLAYTFASPDSGPSLGSLRGEGSTPTQYNSVFYWLSAGEGNGDPRCCCP